MAQQGGGEQQQEEAERPSIWELGPFCALLADPFVDGNSEVPQSSLASACAVLGLLFKESPRLERWKASPIFPHIAFLQKLVTTEVKDVPTFGEFVKVFMEQIKNLPVGEIMFIPGGWIGATTIGSIVFLAEHTSETAWSMVICNGGSGLNYHPCRVCEEDPTKIKYQTCFRIDNIPAERFMDSTFWGTMHSLWLKPSEFHRVEVIYDVLLPWVCGKPTLSEALRAAADDDGAEWRTPQRADSSSAWRSLMEAVRYFLRHNYGDTVGDLKFFKRLLKVEMLTLALQDLEDSKRDPPNSDQRVMLELACRTVSHSVLKQVDLEERQVAHVHGLVNAVLQHVDKAARDEARELERLESGKPADDLDFDKDEAANADGADLPFPEPLPADGLQQDDSKFPGLRINETDVERYAGLAKDPRTSLVSDLLKVPTSPVHTVQQAVAALVRCELACKELAERCRDGSSFSSRVALQLQAAELIRTVVTEVVPIPSNSGPGAIWKSFPTIELERSCLQLVYRLTMAYAASWQSFDAPTRGFDSERSVVAMSLLAIFDCVLRNDRFGMPVATVLHEDGGFCLSTSVCVANLTLYRLASTMELHLPSLARARAACLDYFEKVKSKCKFTDLFTYRMPTDKIEVKKYGTSVLFLRKVMERCGYELLDRTNPNPPPEIESLLEWMTSPQTLLAQEQPEFGLLRDMACLFKFLATMESRESELQRQRIAPSEFVSWGLSFEDTSMESRTFNNRRSVLGGNLRWEVLNYRGLDLDTADVQVTAFGDRAIYFGEGLVVHSPADIASLLNHAGDHRPTEDDILHADSLPSFGDTLSRQESEMLLSYLTVPYLRIPLVLAFFASGDRVTYLFNHGLQALLRAVLFDSADWVPNGHEEKIETVPVSTSGFKSSLDSIIGGGRSSIKSSRAILGTHDGLLLNELRHAPESTLRPLMKMLRSINDLAEASVYSPDAALSLYMVELALDVQAFFDAEVVIPDERRAEMRSFLTGTCRTILKKWLREAMEENDIDTSCMIHAYLALLWSNTRPDEMDTASVAEMLGSLCFVRNWHGFGLAEPSALLGYGSSNDSSAPPEQRLMRFLQAHGVDTTRIAKGSLQKYLGQDRPLYLRVGFKTVRVPSLGTRADSDKKRLLAIVPEQKLFCMLQRQRHHLVSFLESLREASEAVASSTLTKIVRIALDTKGVSLDTSEEDLGASEPGAWTVEARGKYVSPDKEITVDVQGAQIMWRNDELKPLPDSMTHFNDFHVIFGKQQLHCGVVAHQQHRNWVHVVGTKYDLQLWDEPDDKDQGVEAPKDVSPPASGADTANQGPWTCQSCTFQNLSQTQPCQMCGAASPATLAASQRRNGTAGANGRPGGQGGPRPGGGNEEEEEDMESKSPSAIEFRGARYDRHLNPFDEETLKKFTDENEKWVLELLIGALTAHYKEKLPFKLLMPAANVDRNARTATAMAGVITQHEVERPPAPGTRMFSLRPSTIKVQTTTWKEFVVYRERRVVQVFNLHSHGRKMYRQLVFSSNAKLAFHSLQPSQSILGASGDLKGIIAPDPSLVVTRNVDGFVETFVPSRLLFGVIPSALLEAYQFWHGQDGVLRGEPLDPDSTWFGANMIEVRKDRTIVQRPYSKRRSMGVVHSVLAGQAAARSRRLVVSSERAATAPSSPSKEAAAAPAKIDEGTVLSLCALGFTPAAAKLALAKCNNNSAFAAEWLLDPSHAAQVAAAEETTTEMQRYRVISHEQVRVHSSPVATEDRVVSGWGQAQNTLQFGQEIVAVERSGDWLRFEDAHHPNRQMWVLSVHPERGVVLEAMGGDDEEDDDGEDAGASKAAARAAALAEEEELRKRVAARKNLVAKRAVDSDSDSGSGLKLVNLLDEPVRTQPLYNLLTTLISIEDLSHILVWADRDSAAVELIELPRLKLRIEPRAGKLFLSDQAGWFVCIKNQRMIKLLDVHSLLLMNQQREIQFLVPNHEVSRPTLTGRPFSTDLICNRGSFAWLQTMDTRYFLYRVHTSQTFLVSQELSASLYLVHLMLLKREYKRAFQLAPSCTVDVPFTPDEGFVWSQLERSLGDRHPDAHACRLKLSLAVLYAREQIKTPWEVHVEYNDYLHKLPRVSAYCRLSREEERKICRMTASGTTLIKNRLAGLSTAELAPVEMRAQAPRVGGAPWNKIMCQTLDYYNNHGTTIRRINFRPDLGQNGFDAFVADIIYSEHILTDEESGVNRQLGFAFLYQLLTAGPVPGAFAKPRSVAEILARYLHLKLSRWGRESVNTGEVEVSNSRHMAQLAAVLAQPRRPWPKIPVDRESVDLLRRGVNLFTDQGRMSNVKVWLDLLDMEFQEVWPSVVANNDPGLRWVPGFSLPDIPNSLGHPLQPALVDDTGRSEFSAGAQVADMMRQPLAELCSEFVRTVPSSAAAPADKLPFDLHSHPAARPPVAREILDRLEEDVRGYAKSQKGRMDQELVSVETGVLERLINELEALQEADAKEVQQSIATLEEALNRLREDPMFELSLRTRAHLRDRIDFSLVTQALLSRSAAADLKKVNPTLETSDVDAALEEAVNVLVRSNRISHANRTAALARELRSLGGGSSRKSTRTVFRAQQVATALAESLSARRHYVAQDGTFDPRFLVFEYVFDILLRERQVEIVLSFAEDVKTGRSHVQQMIMGAGKTTVVAPLLTLLLADGDTLVTQVMPTALLEQTRHIMRSRFAAIITKRVFTLEFDRSYEDSADVARTVFNKLDEARRSRSVVCASPDAVKSLFLKFVEHIHSLDSVDPEVLTPSTSLRQNREIVQLRETMQCRSDMADSLVPIFRMWADGVLIMDEVDVLLHPLRSELNFPIGLKDPIDMAGFRWDLPIHLLSAFFPETLDEIPTGEQRVLLEKIEAVVEKGYQAHALQRNPHLVLLDEVFYEEHMMRLAAQWCGLWIAQSTHDLPSVDLLADYMCAPALTVEDGGSADLERAFESLSGTNMKLLNLGRDWIRVLLPHVLAKIDRVSFGVLSPEDLANIDQRRTPISRKLMAVPFVGKDVPSRSSEFAHPDVVIGLTVLGYRYEGLRMSDVRTIVAQLKADFTRQVGPRDQRPASVLFREWLEHASKDSGEQLPVLPLPLFQVNDPKQLTRLYQLLRKEHQVITYYLRQHVFPACMNFQSIKISACGHELGSSMLFQKRIGFSGTPSNLLPNDLGTCLYEPGSDGKIMHVLSSEEVVTVERKADWTAKSLLRDVATATPHYHALIDTGALITGMDNEQVARYLLEYLPSSRFEGVVFLDRADRKMFLQRSSGKCLLLSQCGVDPSRRFTFYDQVHTTGMDIKQAPDATAVVTIGKDMTFRDYAQGSFRMRGIGAGQTVRVYLIPEVEQLIKNELYGGRKTDTVCKALDVPAWLLINSMKTETVQHSMLSLQELYNCWRKEALQSLVSDVERYSPHVDGAPKPVSASERLRRFLDAPKDVSSASPEDGAAWLRRCITLFREPVGYSVPDAIPNPQPFHEKIKNLIEDNTHFVRTDKAAALVDAVADRVKDTKHLATEDLEAEIVNENEQEQQQQQEEEAEEEQEKVSRYTRDDEQANPWLLSHLNSEPTCKAGEAPFYRMNAFSVRESQPRLTFPPRLLLSDNWFRPRWIGLGDRRLKNVLVVLEWSPKSFASRLTKLIPLLHQHFCEEGLAPNAAALRALSVATAPRTKADVDLRIQFSTRLRDAGGVDPEETYYVAVALAEAETLRRVLHTRQATMSSDFALLSIEDGSAIDVTPGAVAVPAPLDTPRKKLALSCLRFVNCDMHYTDDELAGLERAFAGSSIPDRIHFFEDCLRLRRREKYLWGDTPLAKLFTDKAEWHLLEARARLQQMGLALTRMLRSSKNQVDLLALFSRMDKDSDGALTYGETQRLLEDLRLGFSPADIATVVELLDQEERHRITWDGLVGAFALPPELLTIADDAGLDGDLEEQRWVCSNCTFAWNFPGDVECQVCGYGWDGTLHVPSDKWMCDPAMGGCSLFNDESLFYCEICNKSRPNLNNIRF